MQRYIYIAVLAAALFTGVEGHIPRANSAVVCSVVKQAITKAKQQTQATAFCASYLHIAKATTTTITSYTGTSTAMTTVTSSSCPSPNTKRAAEILDEGGLGPTLQARAPAAKSTPKPKPSCLSKYSAAAALSAACKCLSIQPGNTLTATTYANPVATRVALPSPACTAFHEEYTNGRGQLITHDYKVVYAGCGYVAPDAFGPYTNVVGDDLCSFAEACAVEVNTRNFPDFYVAHSIANNQYQCFAGYTGAGTVGDFSQESPNFDNVYGYFA